MGTRFSIIRGVNMGAINENLMKKIRSLSNISETEYPFITLYMNVNSYQLFEQQRKNRIFLKNSITEIENKLKDENNRHKLECFKNDVERIQHFIENDLKTRTHGLAIFACDRLGIFEIFETIMPFENEFIANSIPHLKQLAYQADERENALVIISDSKYARIFVVKLGGFILEESVFKHEVLRFHHQGGWAQMRYQRHIENQSEKHYSDVAKAATKLLDEYNFENVILVGKSNNIKKLQQLLPKRVKTQIISANNLDLRENVNTVFEINSNLILENIVESLKNNEDKKEFNCVEEIINKAPINSVTGMQDTIKLVQDGRSETLVIPNYKKYSGWKCNGCFYVAKNQHQPGCVECNGNSQETDLIEELIRLNFRHSGKIEIVKNHAAEVLEKYEGIGALIRY